MNLTFATTKYTGQKQQVSWNGISLTDGEEFNTFMKNDVASRLYDQEGRNEFESHLRSLPSTGFAKESLNRILSAEILEERDWVVGEALAEAWLSKEYNAIWPWNMERDKRNPKASLPGADLIGFIQLNEETRFVFGEVKSSSEQKYPPQVMSGRHGYMGHQIDNLATNLSLICQLFKWLLPRCKGTQHESLYNFSIILYLNSGNKAVSLFGILIRDTAVNELDLKARGQVLGDTIQSPTNCQLVALYVPCKIKELPTRVKGGKTL